MRPKQLHFRPVLPQATPPAGFRLIGRWLSSRVNLAAMARRFGPDARVCVGKPWPLVLRRIVDK